MRLRCTNISLQFCVATSAWFASRQAVAVADTGVLPTADQPHFAADDLGLVHHLAVGLGSVVVLALLGCLAVYVARKYGLALPRTVAGGDFSLRILASRRVSPRLHVAAIQISHDRIVILADNGQAIEKLAEFPVDSAPGTRQ